jgi:hypothetical protein
MSSVPSPEDGTDRLSRNVGKIATTEDGTETSVRNYHYLLRNNPKE